MAANVEDIPNVTDPASGTIVADSFHLPQHKRPVFVGDVDKWRCPLCKEVLEKSVQTECGHRFCERCLKSYLSKNKRMCPVGEPDCVELHFNRENMVIYPDHSARKDINALLVECLYMIYGCMVNLPYKDYAEHIKSCSKKRFPCINAIHGCTELFVSEEEQNQHKKECMSEPNKYNPKQMRKMANKLDTQANTISQQNNEIHDLNDKVRQLQRKQLDLEHQVQELNENKEKDLEKMTDIEDQLSKQIGLLNIKLAENDLRFQLIESASFNGILIWKICNYSKRKADAVSGKTLSLYSQPFYTDYHGYKMCGRVYLNGDGMGKGNHISVFITMMRGDYDALLPWPFRHKVTFMILDQTASDDHKKDSFRPDPNSSSFARPKTEMNIASGCPKFALQSEIEHDTSKYRKDDTIFLKIAIDVAPANQNI